MGQMKQVTKMNPEAKALFLIEIRKRIPPVEEQRKVAVGFLKLKIGNSLSLDGMICEAYLKAHNLGWDGYNNSCCLGSSHIMPKEVMQWAGFTRRDPYIERNGSITTLTQFNDKETPNITEELVEFIDKAL